MPVAGRTSQVVCIVEPRPATQNTALISPGSKVFSRGPGFEVLRIRFLLVQTSRPFPPIPAHLFNAVWTDPLRKTTNGTCRIDLCLIVIRQIRISFLAPTDRSDHLQSPVRPFPIPVRSVIQSTIVCLSLRLSLKMFSWAPGFFPNSVAFR